MIAAEKIKKRERDASLRDLWRTPQWLFVAIQRYIGVKFDVDVACNKDNALLPNFIGVERDALKCSWGEPGTVAFLNPPYSKITPWIMPFRCFLQHYWKVSIIAFVRSGIRRWIRLLRKERCLRCEMGSLCLSAMPSYMKCSSGLASTTSGILLA